MLGMVYLFMSFFTGYIICTMAFPGLYKITGSTYDGEKLHLSPYFVLVPAWYVTGTLLLTWVTYFAAYFFRNNINPLQTANTIVLPLFFIIDILLCIKKWIGNKYLVKDIKASTRMGFSIGEIIFIVCCLTLSMVLMWVTFYIKGNDLYVGSTVFSDFSPHIGMIRSFSYGNNFPTGYSHFAGEDIRYHFMYQFMVGNLEYLGLPLDYAFNIPSILSFTGTFMLLYVIGVKISGKKGVGFLASLFFAFRSSQSLFNFLSQIPKGTSIWQALIDNRSFIAYTPNEDWGLWNLNVYANQRHLAFSLIILLFLLLIFLPHVYTMFSDIIKLKKRRERINSENENLDNKTSSQSTKRRWIDFHQYIKTIFFRKETWIVGDIPLAVAAGILLGAIAFWNGAVLIATLAVLFVIGIGCVRRGELLIMAVIATLLSLLQSKIFISGSSISPSWYFGFIAQNPTLFGVMAYLKELLGVLPLVLFAAFLFGKGEKKYLITAFSMPLLLAFTVSLTVDVTVNHKYIMISVMLLGIMAADFLVSIYQKHNYLVKAGCILIVFTLVSTGVYDFFTVIRKNQPETAIVLNLDDELTKWIQDNSNSKDIYLTSNYALNQVVLGGAMLYQGWQYYAWSAGYDTLERDYQVKLMYEADTPNILKDLVEQNQIRYIIIDYDNRYSDAYELNEDNIRNTYICVYQEGENDWATSIYDTKLPITSE